MSTAMRNHWNPRDRGGDGGTIRFLRLKEGTTVTIIEPETGIRFEADLLNSAEKELAAFARAVCEMLGPDHVRQSVQDWIEELELLDWPQDKHAPNWRHVTVAAASRLASRTKRRCEGVYYASI